jgi:aminopeptidase-like protein
VIPETTTAASSGDALHALVTELYPICRSITGDGVRRTLDVIGRTIPLTVREVPSGTPVLDWTVPLEWNIRDAYVADSSGRRVIDFRESTLHVVSYSVPVRARLSRAELEPHLVSLPDRPEWVPYRTSYYERGWGFCVSERVRRSLPDGEYDVVIDSSLEPGALTFGECVLEGESSDEVLVSCHVCHPALCNDNLSGIAVATLAALELSRRPRRWTYRFLFIPGTIGAITWLALNEAQVARVRHGLVVTGVGDPGPFTYKRSRRGDAVIDRAVAHVLAHAAAPHAVRDFSPYGYDERQYCSPGFDLPVGCLMRTPWGEYPQYHSSGDDLSFVTPGALADSLAVVLRVCAVLEGNRRFLNVNPKGEPQLGRRGLYGSMGGVGTPDDQMAMLWVLNQSDGTRTLLDIAARAAMPFEQVHRAAGRLQAAGLLREVPETA